MVAFYGARSVEVTEAEQGGQDPMEGTGSTRTTSDVRGLGLA